MEVCIESTTGNALATVAIGERYYNDWRTYAYPSWERYCRRHGLGLFVLRDYVYPEKTEFIKRPNWEKLLVFSVASRMRPDIEAVCYIDTDFLISPIAPDIFTAYAERESIGLVSQYKNMPYPDEEVRRRVAFFRNRYYSKEYPLDSSLFITLKDLSAYHGKSELYDCACSGLILGSLKRHAQTFEDWYFLYRNTIQSITDGGDEFHINWHAQQYGKIQWLSYKFHALWLYEMAWKYPFLYNYGRNDKDLIAQCIEASLLGNYFLHFAGSWYESRMLTDVHTFGDDTVACYESFADYLRRPVTGKPVGPVKPSTCCETD